LGTNSIGRHLHTVQAYVVISVVLIAVLRRQKDRFVQITWLYVLASYLVHMSAFLFVPQDELREVWFYSLIVGVYIMLGQKAGAVMALLAAVSLIAANGHSSAPMTERALGTWLASILSLSIIFHAYTSRSLSYYKRMRSSNKQLRHLSQHDALTGVMNLRAMNEVTDRLIKLAQRHGHSYAVLFIDLDHFKRINDVHGHEAGDVVLKAVAECLLQRLRTSDVLGRIGGEEFLAFLPDTDEAGALRLAEQLRQDIESLQPKVSSGPLTVTASIGVSINRQDQGSLAALQREADQAMYQAKAAGRNRVTRFAA
jgi:diguanylate cyclase (GGDEF)-like protein